MEEWTPSDSLRKHMLAVEGAMRAYAAQFDEDVERWGLAGLMHDFDYERFPNDAHAAGRGASVGGRARPALAWLSGGRAAGNSRPRGLHGRDA